jgi:oxalate decarboxylase/phosphoglucose isomerase-like protein (cupin superfamily)
MIKRVRVKELKIADENKERAIYEITSKKENKHSHVGFIKFKPGAKFPFHYHKDLDEIYVPIEGELVVLLYDARKKSKSFGISMEVHVKKPMKIFIPPGVEHAYINPTKKKAIMVLLSNYHWHKRYNLFDKAKNKEFLSKVREYKKY